MATAEVTVHGAGIFGLACAWAMARRGARVQVIDPSGVGAGSSGGIVGALAPHAPDQWNAKKQFQLESLLMAQGFWAEVAGAGGVDPGYARLGRLQPVADERELDLARRREATSDALWGEAVTWRVVPARGQDWEPQSPTGFLVQDTLTARLHPRRAGAALVAAIAARGGSVVAEGHPAGRQVWATGWRGLADLSADLGKTVGQGVKGQAVLVEYDARDRPQLFAGGLHVVPHGDGTVAIGSTSETGFAAPDTTDARADDLLRAAVAALPVLAGAPVLERWAGVRPRARSRAPMLGAWPGRPGHYVANGGFKIGFGMAPKVAEVMADLVLEDRDSLPEGFRVEASL